MDVEITIQERLFNIFSKTRIPCVESIHGIDAVAPNYEYNLGFIGKYGERFSNHAFYNSDF